MPWQAPRSVSGRSGDSGWQWIHNLGVAGSTGLGHEAEPRGTLGHRVEQTRGFLCIGLLRPAFLPIRVSGDLALTPPVRAWRGGGTRTSR